MADPIVTEHWRESGREMIGGDHPNQILFLDLVQNVVHPDWEAHIKWDGCMTLTRVINDGSTSGDRSDIHICNLDDLITVLTDLRDNIEYKVVI